MKVKDVIKALEADGWVRTRHKGSHRQYRKPGNPHVVTVAGKPNVNLPDGTLANLRRSTGLPLR